MRKGDLSIEFACPSIYIFFVMVYTVGKIRSANLRFEKETES